MRSLIIIFESARKFISIAWWRKYFSKWIPKYSHLEISNPSLAHLLTFLHIKWKYKFETASNPILWSRTNAVTHSGCRCCYSGSSSSTVHHSDLVFRSIRVFLDDDCRGHAGQGSFTGVNIVCGWRRNTCAEDWTPTRLLFCQTWDPPRKRISATGTYKYCWILTFVNNDADCQARALNFFSMCYSKPDAEHDTKEGCNPKPWDIGKCLRICASTNPGYSLTDRETEKAANAIGLMALTHKLWVHHRKHK